MTEPASSPPASPPSDTEGIEEILLCSGDGQVFCEWPSAEAGGRAALFDPIFKFSESLAQTLSLGRVARLEVETTKGRIILLLQPNRRLFVRSSANRKKP
jgi:predicted regulator of Ras-like GTPase activity (Roadblock/LC7/MglB family)